MIINDYGDLDLNKFEISRGCASLSNPLKDVLLVDVKTPDTVLTLPPVNLPNSYPIARAFFIVNTGLYELMLAKNGATKLPEYSVPVNEILSLRCIDNAKPEGEFSVNKILTNSQEG